MRNLHDRITQHGEQLLAIFPNAIERDPVKLCKRLRRLEVCGSKAAEAYCNGDFSDAKWVIAKTATLAGLRTLLKPGDVPVFISGDPRGYALKIDNGYMAAHGVAMHRDLGGYGILAPDLTEGD